ncbi:MAG TPA: hypothetical protein VM598_01805 [Bdellovibrionota bacterium]|nr:hypothetical protein [Bdellovibrionota bacterium]
MKVVHDPNSRKISYIHVDLLKACVHTGPPYQVRCEIDLSKAGQQRKLVIQGTRTKQIPEGVFCYEGTRMDGLFGQTWEGTKWCLPANPTIVSPVPIDFMFWTSSERGKGPKQDPETTSGSEGEISGDVATFKGAQYPNLKSIVKTGGAKIVRFDTALKFGIAPVSLRLKGEIQTGADVAFFESLKRGAEVIYRYIVEARDIAVDKPKVNPVTGGEIQVWVNRLKDEADTTGDNDQVRVRALAERLEAVAKLIRGDQPDGTSRIAVTDLTLRQELSLMMAIFDMLDYSLKNNYANIDEACENGTPEHKATRAAACRAVSARNRLSSVLNDIRETFKINPDGGTVSKTAEWRSTSVLYVLHRLRVQLGMVEAGTFENDPVNRVLGEVRSRFERPGGILDVAAEGDTSAEIPGKVRELAEYWNDDRHGQFLIRTFNKPGLQNIFQEIQLLHQTLLHLGSMPGIAARFDFNVPLDPSIERPKAPTLAPKLGGGGPGGQP